VASIARRPSCGAWANAANAVLFGAHLRAYPLGLSVREGVAAGRRLDSNEHPGDVHLGGDLRAGIEPTCPRTEVLLGSSVELSG
jgi:hypothetical protein